MDMILGKIASLGASELGSILSAAGKNVIKNHKDANAWKKVFQGAGSAVLINDKQDEAFFKDLVCALSEGNMTAIASSIQNDDGYELKPKLYNSFMELMRKYEIPYEYADMYSYELINIVIGEIRVVSPEKYEQYYLQEWRDEQEKNYKELQNRLDKLTTELSVYNEKHLKINSSGQMDLELRRSTHNPSIGIEFFEIDDEKFRDIFDERRYDEMVFARGRCREETIYCILNELWRIEERRPIFVVNSIDSWKKLQEISSNGNIYIPNFYSDEIVAIEGNTNIFVLNDNTPAYNQEVIYLRPRTRDTLDRCLRNAGMDYDKAYKLLADTHGLYIPMKKQLFHGEYLKRPKWIDSISPKAIKTAILLGQWEESEGDKLVIGELYGSDYEDFINEVLPYTADEDPFLYVSEERGHKSFYLASTENTWECEDISVSEPIWQRFEEAVIVVLNESEDLFTLEAKERLLAQLRGEKLFWSQTIRSGMLNTLIMKGAYSRENAQTRLNALVRRILDYVRTEKQWSYIATFWTELCEIAPETVLDRLETEEKEPTGLISLFENQSSDVLFGRNPYINILWGVEQFLVQKDYFWRGYRWLLRLDSKNYTYTSNSPKDIFLKVLCPWFVFSAAESETDKTNAASVAFELSETNAWEYIFESVESYARSIVGTLSSPKYRECIVPKAALTQDFYNTSIGYIRLLLKHMDFSSDRWKKMINLTDSVHEKLRKEIFGKLLIELEQMSDDEKIEVKNSIRSFIYKHRFYKTADWALPEHIIKDYEVLLNSIHTEIPEYEYGYLFKNGAEHPLLHPVPYKESDESKDNDRAVSELIERKLKEFKEKGYRLSVLAKVCSNDSFSKLGRYLAKYWNNGVWDYDVFIMLLKAQESGQMAIDYMSGSLSDSVDTFPELVEKAISDDLPVKIIASIYRQEALITKGLPLIVNASERIKKEFWSIPFTCYNKNNRWAISESKKYASLNDYLDLLHSIHYSTPLTAQDIYEYLEDVEKMPHSQGGEMMQYHIEQLLSVVQKEYLDDTEKCHRIAELEIFFSHIMNWKEMRCFNHLIKESPDVFFQLVSVVFKKDHPENDDPNLDKNVLHNMYTLYEKAHFCPAEENGIVSEEKLDKWIGRFKELLEQNDQGSLFTRLLGRLLSFSPVGADGYEPCEAVRSMIERYGDEKLISGYQTSVYNRRGVFSPTAGKAEQEMAENFKKTAHYLEAKYPTTSKIFYGLADAYIHEAEEARKDAEDGRF